MKVYDIFFFFFIIIYAIWSLLCIIILYVLEIKMQWLISKLGPKYILDKTIDGATPLHMAAGEILFISPKRQFLTNMDDSVPQ